MIKTKERELKQIYAMVVIVFLVFLLIPIVLLLGKSFEGGGSVSLETTRMWREERDLRLPLAGASLYPVSVQC